MPTKTARVLKMPGFSYRGSDVPAISLSDSLIENLGPGEPAYKLAPKSTPLTWRVKLYEVGRDLSLDIDDFNASSLPTPIKEAGMFVYSDAHERKARRPSGCWHKDGVLIEPGATISGSTRPGEDYVAARYFIDTDGFEQKGEGWDIKPKSRTREERIWLPPGSGSLIVPTPEGIYNPVTGTPFRTVADRDEALRIWMEAGFSREQAGNELSKFYRMNSGTVAVHSWSYDNNGPLCVNLNHEPRDRDTSVGSFPASRRAERSEAPKNSGFMLVTNAEYKAFMADRKTLEAAKKLFGK